MLSIRLLFAAFLTVKICCFTTSANDTAKGSELKRIWGFPDQTLPYGKLLSFNIRQQKDAFLGDVDHYEVLASNDTQWPNWLISEKNSSVLEGVPSTDDLGTSHLCVKAYDRHGKYAQSDLYIEVYPLDDRNTNEQRKCADSEKVMMINIPVNKKFDEINPKQRVSVVKALSEYLKISPASVILLPKNLTVDAEYNKLRYKTEDIISDSASLTSVITWQIGCNSNIWAEQVNVVQLVKESVNNGSLSKIVGLPVTKSHTFSNMLPFRVRRNIGNENEEGDDDDEDDEEGEDDAPIDSEGDLPLKSPLSVRNNSSSVDDEPELPRTKEEMNIEPNSANDDDVDDEDTTEQPLTLDDNDNNSRSKLANAPPVSSMASEQSANVSNTQSDKKSMETVDLSSTTMTTATTTTTTVKTTTPTTTNTTTPTTMMTIITTTATPPTVASSMPKPRIPPRVNKNLNTLNLVAGTVTISQIPDDIFIDDVDGNTRNLTLSLAVPKNETCPYSIWIDLITTNDKNQLRMIPFEGVISSYEFTLVATNSANQSTNTTFKVGVQYPQNNQKINIEFSLHLKMKQRGKQMNADLLYDLLTRLAAVYGDSSVENIIVRNVTCGDSFVFTWTNKTLPLDHCDNATINNLINVLADGPQSTDVKLSAQGEFENFLTVEKVTWAPQTHCLSLISTPRQPDNKLDFSPVVNRNSIDNPLSARNRELFVYKLPSDIFYDPDAQSGQALNITLLTENLKPIPANNWLQFDDKNNEIYGVPMLNSDESKIYHLVCYGVKTSDSNADTKAARQVIVVKVPPDTTPSYSVEFSLVLNESSSEFHNSSALRRKFVEKIADLYDDANTSSIVISRYASEPFTVVWNNKSLPVNTCADDKIEALRKILLQDDGQLTNEVNEKMAPEFVALSGTITPTGMCEGNPAVTHATPPKSDDAPATIFPPIEVLLSQYFYDIVLPISIILVLMIIALIIACFLLRKQRRSKWSLGDADQRRSFRNRGIPVIFQDELEERLEPSNNAPVIMKTEKPPLPPPEYQTTLPMSSTALLSDFEDPTYHNESTFYTSPRDTTGRSNTSSFRKPPPYSASS